MQENNKFAVLILTNNRPNNVKTITTLRKQGYTGKIVLVLDDQDKTIDDYRNNYTDEIIVFSKSRWINLTDNADNKNNPKAVVYARNASFEIAHELGLETFLVLDDDYNNFNFRSNDSDIYIHKTVKNLDDIFNAFIDFINTTQIYSIAFSQGGDFIGGELGGFGKKITLERKCMNSFFCRTDRPFQFYGLINEDVNCYVLNGSRGQIFFTATHIALNQPLTQQNSGGLTTIYLEQGTYVKSFYSVMYHPSSVVVKDMGQANRRLHHEVNKNLSYPKILRETVKKGSNANR